MKFPHLPVTDNAGITRNFEHIQKNWGVFFDNRRDGGIASVIHVAPNEYVQTGREGSTEIILPDAGEAPGAIVGALYYGAGAVECRVKTSTGSGAFYGSGYRGATSVRLDPGDFFIAVSNVNPKNSEGGRGAWVVIAPVKRPPTYPVTWRETGEGAGFFPSITVNFPLTGVYSVWEGCSAYSLTSVLQAVGHYVDGLFVQNHNFFYNVTTTHLRMQDVQYVKEYTAGNHTISFPKSSENLKCDTNDEVYGYALYLGRN